MGNAVAIWTIILSPFVIGGIDLWIYLKLGNSKTISRNMWRAYRTFPLIGLIFAFGFGLLCGHLFLPQHITPLA